MSHECEFPVLLSVGCVRWCPTLCVCDDMYIRSETCMYLHVGAAFVQVWEYLLIPGLLEHPRGTCVNV